MRELFEFIKSYAKWLVCALYVALSCFLLAQGDPYRHHVMLTSASSLAGTCYDIGHGITSFFGLRAVNADLNRRNAELQAEVTDLREQLMRYNQTVFSDTMPTPDSVTHFKFIVAEVINNSVHHAHNFVTIDKGEADGIRPEMGVIDHSGVVGTVSAVGPHYSRVISLLNPNFRLSCKIKRSQHFGSLVWDGLNPDEALLEELPRHTVFEVGDTIVTSGYSAVFPAGIPVGVILPDDGRHQENFFTLRIRLFADFSRLSNVQVVLNNDADEIRQVETNTITNSDPTAR